MLTTILVAAFVITLAIAFADFLLVMGIVAVLLGAGVWGWKTLHATTLADCLTFIEGCGIVAAGFALAWVILTLAEKYGKKPVIVSPDLPHLS